MLKVQLFIRKSILYVRLNGELDQGTLEVIKVKVPELIENYRIKYLVLNCNNLTFMDSSGIGFIIGRYNQLKSVDGSVVLCELNTLCKRIVEISGVGRIVIIKEKEKDVERMLEGCNEKIRRDVI